MQKNPAYLLPLLTNGPSHEQIQLKQALALAHMLGRTSLVTGILEHYSDVSSENRKGLNISRGLFVTEDLFDRWVVPTHLTHPLVAVLLAVCHDAGHAFI